MVPIVTMLRSLLRDDVSFDQGSGNKGEKVIYQGYFGHEINKLCFCIVLGKGCFPTFLVSMKIIFFFKFPGFLSPLLLPCN